MRGATTVIIGLALSALVISAAGNSEASSVNVNVSGYLPAPQGVQIHVSAGRPYYVEQGRRVYMVRDERRHHRKHRHGHDRHEGRGRGEHREHERGRHHER